MRHIFICLLTVLGRLLQALAEWNVRFHISVFILPRVRKIYFTPFGVFSLRISLCIYMRVILVNVRASVIGAVVPARVATLFASDPFSLCSALFWTSFGFYRGL